MCNFFLASFCFVSFCSVRLAYYMPEPPPPTPIDCAVLCVLCYYFRLKLRKSRTRKKLCATPSTMHANVHRRTYEKREQAQNTQINIKSASECVCVFRIVKISRMIKLKWGQQQIHAKQHTHIVRWDFRSFVYVFFLVLFLVSLHSASLAPIELILLKWLFRTIRKKSLIYFYCNWYTQEICVYARRYGAVCIVIERETRSERERERARAGTVIVFMLLIHTNTHYTI